MTDAHAHDEGSGVFSDALFAAGDTPERQRELARRHGIDEARADDCAFAIRALRSCVEPDIIVEEEQPELPSDYELRGELGRGGMGIVYRARHKSLDREVAVKVLRPGEQIFGEMLRRFEVEAKSLAKLRHPNIVRIYDVGRSDGNVFYSMDLIDGASLREELAGGSLTPTRAVTVLLQIARAIEHSHEQGVIHRDLKPGNILIDAAGESYVADFGLARNAQLADDLTTTGQLLGTPAYMSPEAIRGQSDRIGEGTDIYALGALLYECLAGRPPFQRASVIDTIQAALHEDAPPLRKLNPRVPRDLELICGKALSKKPEDRYATAKAFALDLERFLSGHPVLATKPSFARRCGRWLARNRGPLIGAAAAASLVLAIRQLLPAPAPNPSIVHRIAAAGERQAKGGQRRVAQESFEHARALLGEHARTLGTAGASRRVAAGLLAAAATNALADAKSRDSIHDAIAMLERVLRERPAKLGALHSAHARAALCILNLRAGKLGPALEIARDTDPQFTQHLAKLLTDRSKRSEATWAVFGHFLVRMLQSREPQHPLVDSLRAHDTSRLDVAGWLASRTSDNPRTRALSARFATSLLEGDEELQWRRADSASRALLTISRDHGLDARTRLRALDLAFAREDMPWRPDTAIDEAFVDSEACVRLRARLQTMLDSRRAGARVPDGMQLAVELAQRDPEDPLRSSNALDIARWLSEHGEAIERATTARSRIRSRTRKAGLERSLDELGPRLLTIRANGLDAGTRATIPSLFEALGSDRDKRVRLHNWLRSVAPSAAPRWPSGEAEPQNLVPSWLHGLRSRRSKLDFIVHERACFADGRIASSWTTRSVLRETRDGSTWFETSGSSLSDRKLFAAIEQNTPTLALRAPGVDFLHGHALPPMMRTSIDAKLVWRRGSFVRFSTGNTASARGAAGRSQTPYLVPLGRVGVQVHDDVVWGVGRKQLRTSLVAIQALRIDENDPRKPRLDALGEIRRALGDFTASARGAGPLLERACEALALTDGARHDVWDARARYRVERTREQILELDQLAQLVRAGRSQIAALVRRLARPGEAPKQCAARVRALLLRPLAARLFAGDESAASDSNAELLVAHAEALGIDTIWWTQLAARAREARIRSFALDQIRRGEIPRVVHSTLRDLGTALPTEVARVLQRESEDSARHRQQRRAGLVAWLALLCLLSGIVATRALRGRPSPRLTCALLCVSLLSLVAPLRFGLWLVLPGWIPCLGLTLACWSMRITTARKQTTLLCLATFLLAAAASITQSGYVGAVATIACSIALAWCAAEVARAGFASSTALRTLSLLAGASFLLVAAYVTWTGIVALFQARNSTLTTLVLEQALGSAIHDAAIAAGLALSLVALAGIFAAKVPEARGAAPLA